MTEEVDFTKDLLVIGTEKEGTYAWNLENLDSFEVAHLYGFFGVLDSLMDKNEAVYSHVNIVMNLLAQYDQLDSEAVDQLAYIIESYLPDYRLNQQLVTAKLLNKNGDLQDVKYARQDIDNYLQAVEDKYGKKE